MLEFLISPVVLLLLAVLLYLVPLTLMLKQDIEPVQKFLWFLLIWVFSWLGFIAFKMTNNKNTARSI